LPDNRLVIYEQQFDHVFLFYVFLHISESVGQAGMVQWLAKQMMSPMRY
jgi:hypothetical protein